MPADVAKIHNENGRFHINGFWLNQVGLPSQVVDGLRKRQSLSFQFSGCHAGNKQLIAAEESQETSVVTPSLFKMLRNAGQNMFNASSICLSIGGDIAMWSW
jgi:hypothetical protein